MVEDVQAISNSLTWFIWATKGLSVGAIVFQWLELVNTIPDEVEYLWRTRTRLVTYLYAWSRYFPFFAQIVNFVFSELIRRPYYASSALCMTTFILKAATGQLATTCIEAILMVRVHALYNCDRRMGFLLLTIMIVGTAFEIAGTTTTMLGLQPGAGGSICIPRKSPRNTLVLFVVGCGLNQSTLLVMTVARVLFYKDLTGSWLRTAPVVRLMLRDGLLVFILLSVVVTIVIVFELTRNDAVPVWSAAFSWYVALVSIAGCRLIMNMRKLAASPSPNPSAVSVELSTILSFDADACLSEVSLFSEPSQETEESDSDSDG